MLVYVFCPLLSDVRPLFSDICLLLSVLCHLTSAAFSALIVALINAGKSSGMLNGQVNETSSYCADIIKDTPPNVFSRET